MSRSRQQDVGCLLSWGSQLPLREPRLSPRAVGALANGTLPGDWALQERVPAWGQASGVGSLPPSWGPTVLIHHVGLLQPTRRPPTTVGKCPSCQLGDYLILGSAPLWILPARVHHPSPVQGR